MSGHGCPSLERLTCAAKRVSAFAFVAALALLVGFNNLLNAGTQESAVTRLYDRSVAPSFESGSGSNRPASFEASASSSATRDRDLRLRLSWGGASSETWVGQVAIGGGAVSELIPLGLTKDAPASVSLVGGAMQVHHLSATNYGGADITLTGDSDSQVHFLLSSLEHPELRFEKTVSLEALLSESVGGDIDGRGNRFSAVRAPGDELRVEFSREHLVFRPREMFRFTIHPNAPALSDRAAVCRVRLVPAKSSRINSSRFNSTQTFSIQMNNQGTAEPQEVSLVVPADEAVYNIEIELEPSQYQASFGSRKHTLSRKIQLLVLDEEAPRADDREWETVSVVDLAGVSRDAFRSWSQFSRATGLSKKDTLGNARLSSVSLDGREMLQLAPGGWQAIPLSVGRIGEPHKIELEYQAAGEMAIGLSVLQPDSTGQIPLFGADSGVNVPRSIVSAGPDGSSLKLHRINFWPQTKTPYLLIANRHATAAATLGEIRVLAGPERILVGMSDQADSKFSSAVGKRSNRKLMAFYESPLFPENFAASEAMDPQVAQPLDDWQTFYDGADRFVQHLKSNSYGGAFVTVVSDGSSIYPSQLLAPSPQHDNGVFFGNGQDPIRKDVLEMLFRMFEREGLSLVPALAMSAPIPEVEVTRKRDGSESAFELVDLNGGKRPPESEDHLPIYNPLNRGVQRAVRRIVRELAERYQGFESFEGVAILCRPDTYTLLPGRQWGYDAATLQQFVQLQSDLDSLPQPWTEAQQVLLGSHREQWVQWRAEQMSRWYRDLASQVSQARPGGKLYLAPVDLYRNEEMASVLSPSLHSSPDFGQIMMHMGFDSGLLQAQDSSDSEATSVVLLQPHRIAPDESLALQRVDLAIENSLQAQEFFANVGYAGDLYTHRMAWAHFKQLEDQSPFGAQATALMRLQTMSPADSFNRKRFVESIKNRDARLLVDGGLTLATGQVGSLQDMLDVYRQLPDLAFEDVASASQSDSRFRPVVVRQLNHEGQSYFYAANASPWPINVRVKLAVGSAPPTLTPLSRDIFVLGKSESGSRPEQTQYVAAVEIPAYGLVGAKMLGQDRVAEFEFELPTGSDRDLRRHVFALQAKLTQSSNPAPLSVIENPDFEFNGQPTLGGWDTGQQSSGEIRLGVESESGQSPAVGGASDDSQGQRPQQASLVMTNTTGGPVWVRSNFFESTETGRLSISVWLKTDDLTVQPPLRLALEGQSRGVSYYRFGSVGSLSPDLKANQIGSNWKRFAVHFDDLPVEGLGNVRIGFDLMGPGQVAIDNVQVFDRWFDGNDIKAMTQLLASTGPLLSNPETHDSCRRLLEGYWPSFLDQFVGNGRSGESGQSQDGDSNDVSGLEQGVSLPRDSSDRAAGGDRADVNQAEGSQAESDEPRESIREADRKVPMFRRFRGLVPQRKSPSRS